MSAPAPMRASLLNNSNSNSTTIVNEAELIAEMEHREHDGIVAFWGLVLGVVVSQWFLNYWKKKHFRSYHIVTLASLFLVPFFLSWQLGYWRMIGCWFIFVLLNGYVLHRANEIPIRPSTPRFIYLWFYSGYYLSSFTGLTGYILVLVAVFLSGSGLEQYLVPSGLMFLFYGTYFGVLLRDLAEVSSWRLLRSRPGYLLSSASGRHSAKRKDSPSSSSSSSSSQMMLPTASFSPQSCALCAETLTNFEPITMSCHHSFHEFCLRGWLLVGKKDTCPYCQEKIQVSAIWARMPWERANDAWTTVLDWLRYLIAWNPLIILVIHVVMTMLGLTHEAHMKSET